MTLVLFDIDGTLLRTNGSGRGAMAMTAGELFGRPDMFDSVSFAGAVDSGIVALAMEACGIPATGRRMGRMRLRYERRLRRGLKEQPGEVCPGVHRLLSDLQGRAKVGLITGNWHGGARIKLEAHGLGSTFAGCVGAYGGDAAERNALLPYAVKRAFRRWGKMERVLVVGDTPADVACARAGQQQLPDLEVVAVAVETGFSTVDSLRESEPDLQIVDLDQGREAFLALL